MREAASLTVLMRLVRLLSEQSGTANATTSFLFTGALDRDHIHRQTQDHQHAGLRETD